jgi:hypothetical protein
MAIFGTASWGLIVGIIAIVALVLAGAGSLGYGVAKR